MHAAAAILQQLTGALDQYTHETETDSDIWKFPKLLWHRSTVKGEGYPETEHLVAIASEHRNQ
jgi:hypothetical protein